jgi:hypothetical protein
VALLAAAVCPHPPLLVPAVAGASPELDDLRAACLAAVQGLLDRAPELVVIVGDAASVVDADQTASGSLAGFGVDVRSGDPPPAVPALPLSLMIGAWLLDAAGWTGRRRYLGLPDSTSSSEAAASGAQLAADPDRIALLVMGDGSARRSSTAPGYLDPRAAEFDATVATSLTGADAPALLALDADLAHDLLAAGRASWQVLAGAISADSAAAGHRWTGELLLDVAPYGVGYFVTTAAPEPAAG